MIKLIIKEDQLWNIDETDFIQKQNSCKVVVSKGSINMWSECADANFHMTFSVCVSADKAVVPSLLILPGKRLNRDVLKGFGIEGDHVTTAPFFYQLYLILKSIIFFADSVPDSVVCPLVLVYDGFCRHYNDNIVKNQLILN